MKRFPRSASVLSSLLLIATLCQPLSATELIPSAPSADVTAGNNPAPLPNAPATDPILTALYDCIDKGEAFVTYECDAYLTSDYLSELMIDLLDNTPEFFYLEEISITYTANKNPDGSLKSCVYRFAPIYNLSTKDEILAAKAEWEQLLADILKIVTPSMSDFEKVLILHDYLCTHFQYDTTLTIRDSYRFLTEKTGVCEAYAGTYSALLDRLGIANLYAVSAEMNHIWNVVQIDGEWYHVDITWDDPTADQPGKAKHDAFLRSDRGMTEIGHTNWTCDVACTSTKYDQSILSDITSAVVTDGNYFYAVDNKQPAIMRVDLDSFTAEPIVDLSAYRWMVWGEPYYWNACFTNLYCDGEWLYYSTPLGIEALDLRSGKSQIISSYDKGDGYLYAMRYENHQLICTVSTKPAASEGEFIIPTRHRFSPTAINGIFVTSACVDCDESRHTIHPPKDNIFAVAASARPSPEKAGAHDIRISLSIDLSAISPLGPIEYSFSLNRSDGSTNTLLLHSVNDTFSEFQIYESLSAGDKVYSPNENNLLTGFFINAIEDKSWNSLSFTISQPEARTILYDGSLTYEDLIAETAT